MNALRYIPLPLAVLSLFIFPWAITLLAMAASALAHPLSALAVGILADILYYPGVGLPVGSLWGAGLATVGFFVRSFVKERML